MAGQDPMNAAVINEPYRNNLANFGFKIVHDGNDDFYFDRNFFKPFLLALGRIIQDGVSLKDVFDGISPANVSGRAHVVPSKMVNGAQLPLGNVRC